MLLRRNRLIVIGAALMVFMLYRVLQNSWDESYEQAIFSQYRHRPQPAPAAVDHVEDSQQPQEPLHEAPAVADHKSEDSNDKASDEASQDENANEDEGSDVKPGTDDQDSEDSSEAPAPTETQKTEEEVFSPKDAADIVESEEDKDIEIMWMNPPNDESNVAFHHKSDVHWKKPQEHFPLPPESLISLPTGTPEEIPKIQYDFGPESSENREVREKRLGRVKDEIVRTWSGYKKYAWMHDELMPVSAKSKDPFCGWAATLVDSLDTLWITGLKAEFDEAAKAVEDIDFTWTKRHDIPVFETTIRYLGGLVAAFDVSGGHKGDYKVLLDKAVELAEILMGIFDTPNRMPVLYYQWKPDYTSQPHRAGKVGIAELATLSMEFTRLAQLTGEDKYYDAVDRITNGLVEMQEAGTLFPGLFPENIDASGCNKTATTIRDTLSNAAQAQLDSEGNLSEPDSYESGRHPFGEDRKPPKGSVGASQEENLARRDYEDPTSADSSSTIDQEVRAAPDDSPSVPTPGSFSRGPPPFAADGKTSTSWDCVPQPLIPAGYGHQEFHMGGGQDSAYEYFPKQYLLLGGLEPKYQKLHEDAVDGINKYLMYRPMMKDDEWDVVFPAKVSTNGLPKNDAIARYEVTHLTCFIGGMYGLGGKIFGREKDIETAKQLTDGCVWAYSQMPSGLMPEASRVVPCPGLEKCEFNQTLWWSKLDSSKDWRDAEFAKWEAAEADLNSLTGSKSQSSPVPETEEETFEELRAKERSSFGSDEDISDLSKRGELPLTPGRVERKGGSELPESLRKKLGLPDEEEPSKSSQQTTDSDVEEDDSYASVKVAADEEPARVPRPSVPPKTARPSEKPMTHEEYVKKKIRDYSLPPGFVDITASNYILRPEAIESVWYMYRITGDPEWMDKGWKMFQATIQATRTQFANSAVADVTRSEPVLLDSMESFWLAETLKYYFLLFSEPDVVSLDEWVLNTEAHPFKRPVP